MHPSELRYNIRRMWSKYGVVDIIDKNGQFLFKFKNKEGMDAVLKSGPWNRITIIGMEQISGKVE